MPPEDSGYIAELLKDSSELYDLDSLRDFLERLNPKRMQEQLDGEIESSAQFADKRLYQRYPQYERHWLNYVTTLRSIILSGETNLSRAVWKVEQALKIRRPIEKVLILGKVQKVPSEIIWQWFDVESLAFLTKYSDEDTNCVVEVGAGPALFLFKFWLSHGPLNANYYALEITQTGRLFTNIMSCLESSTSFRSLYFDYQKPDFSTLRNKYNKVLVFSKGSVEQIPELPKEFFTQLLSISKELTCVHSEPVGWQIVKPYKQDLRTRKHRKRCLKKNYNTNLWALLQELESEGLLAINEYLINFSGKADHPGTYISWTKVS